MPSWSGAFTGVPRANNLARRIGRGIERIGHVLEHIGRALLACCPRCRSSTDTSQLKFLSTQREIAVRARHAAPHGLSGRRLAALQIHAGARHIELTGCSMPDRRPADPGPAGTPRILQLGPSGSVARVIVQRGLNQRPITRCQVRIIDAERRSCRWSYRLRRTSPRCRPAGRSNSSHAFGEVAFAERIDMLVDLKVHQRVEIDALGR